MGYVKLLTVLVLVSATTSALDLLSESIKFSADFYNAVRQAKPDGNIILSPLSVKTALGLLLMGAEGETGDEIVHGLYLPTYSRAHIAYFFQKLTESYSGKSLEIANKIYTKKGYSVKPQFNDIAVKSFNSESESVDLSNTAKAADIINAWVSKKTHGKIPNLFEPGMLSSDSRMVLANAVYFKDSWKEKFDTKSIFRDKFWISETESVNVDLMYKTFDAKATRFKDMKATVVQIPYSTPGSYMMIFLPDSRTGLNQLEKQMLGANLRDLSATLKESLVKLVLPKFEIDSSVQLPKILTKMGMGTMFSGQADFSGLLQTSEHLQMDNAVHKAYIKVDEEGTEAAGATGMDLDFRMDDYDYSVRVDRPFFFAILDPHEVLFIGSVRKP